MSDTVKTLEAAIRATIAKARKDGTCGMSIDCLKANTSTRGLSCSVAMYHAAFDVAVQNVAKSIRGFSIYS